MTDYFQPCKDCGRYTYYKNDRCSNCGGEIHDR